MRQQREREREGKSLGRERGGRKFAFECQMVLSQETKERKKGRKRKFVFNVNEASFRRDKNSRSPFITPF